MTLSKTTLKGWAVAVLASTCLTAGSFVASSPASAQALDEIIVTARKQTENLQDVGAAVSALSAAEIARRFDSDIRDFANISPNVIIDEIGQGPGGVAAATIRGIGISDVERSIDPSVGVVFDDIYFGAASGSVMKAIDIDSVEVLRGPQGTLFGRNAIGGVMKVSRSKPSNEFSGKVRLLAGEDNRLDAEALVNLPLSDNLAVKFSVADRSTDGYGRNATQGKDQGAEDFQSANIHFLLNASEALTLELSYDRQETEQDPSMYSNLATSADAFCSVFGECGQANGAVPQSGDRYTNLGNGPLNQNSKFDMDLTIFRATYNLGDNYELKYIYGKMETEEEVTQDWDSTPLTLYHTDRPADAEQETHELRLTHSGDTFNFVSGIYFWDSEYKINLVSYIGFACVVYGFACPAPNTEPVVIPVPQTVTQTTESQAVFFEADYRVSPKLKLTLGGRYTEDDKTTLVEDFVIDPVDGITSNSASFDETTMKAAVTYDVSDDAMVYALFSQGYRSGGFNGRPQTQGAAYIPYDPETVDNTEIGFKSQFMDNRIRLNGAIFQMDYDDKQQDIDVRASGGTGRENRTMNAATAELTGWELEMSAAVSEALTLSGNIGYLDAKYKDFNADITNDGIPEDLTYLELQRAPEWTATLSALYEVKVGEGDLWIKGDIRYIDEHHISFRNNPNLKNDEQYLIDASINYAINNTQISLFGKNLSDEDGWTIGYDVVGLWSYGGARPPRMIGVALTQSF
jgi:iron complex outermembrane receptor protein